MARSIKYTLLQVTMAKNLNCQVTLIQVSDAE